MKKQYMFVMFILCFSVWALIVDNAVLPAGDGMKQDNGQYSRYRVKEWSKSGKLDFIEDELLVYVVVKNREQCYYMDRRSYFENSLKNLPAGTDVQVRYVNRFPKFWKRHMYDLRIGGVSKISYPSALLAEKQRGILKFTGIMVGVFLLLAVLGMVNKPRRK